MPQATALEGLNIGEVSGVDHPAHLEEGWMVLKAAGAAPEAMEKVEIVEALVDAVEKAAAIEPDLLAQVGAEVLDDSARETLAHLLPTTKATKEAPDMPDFDKSTLDEATLAYVESLESQVAKAADSTPDDEATELAKALDGLPEPLRKAFEKQQADLAEATRVAKAERDLRLDAEYLEKARGFKALGVDTSNLAKTLRKAADLDPDLFVEIDQVLKAADAQIAEGNLYKSLGAPASVIESGSAHDRLDAIAKSLVAEGKASDYATALSKAAEENPDLYAEHRRESLAPKEG